MRHLRVVIIFVLLAITSTGIASAQGGSDDGAARFADIAREQGEQAAFDWLRGKTDDRVAGLRAEIAAIEAMLAEEDAVLLRTTVGVQPLRAAEVEAVLPLYPLYASAPQRVQQAWATLEPVLAAIHHSSIHAGIRPARLVELTPALRFELLKDAILEDQDDDDETRDDIAAEAIERLQSELAEFNGILDDLDAIQRQRGETGSVGSDEVPSATEAPDEPQDEPSDSSTGDSGFDGAWSTSSWQRMELTRSGSSVTGPYGRMNKADENGVRTLGVIGDMDMKVVGERELKGFWIKGSASSVKCKSQMDGSFYWGQERMTFDESFMSWTGGWTYCDSELWRSSRGSRIGEP